MEWLPGGYFATIPPCCCDSDKRGTIVAKEQNKEAELKYYEEYARNLVGEGDDFSDENYKMIFDRFGIADGKGALLLDAGCGSGIYGKRLARRGYNVTGVDLSKEMVSIANSRNATVGFKAIQGDLEDLSIFPENHFDVVFFGQMLHHFPHIAKVIAATRRWLKKGGQMMILEPNGCNPVNQVSKGIGRFFSLLSPEMKKVIGTENERSLGHPEILKYLEENNLAVVKKISFDFRLFISKEEPIPALLRFMLNVRELLYAGTAKILPQMIRGRIMAIIAEKR